MCIRDSYNGASGFYEYVWNTPAAGNGAYTLDARAADSTGNIGSATQINVTVDNGAGCASNCLRVASITFTFQPQGNNYRVFAEVLIVDENAAAVPEAVVAVTWTRPNLSTKSDSQSADGEGIASFNINGSAGGFTLTVDAVSLAGYTFDFDNSVLSNTVAVP